ncbi:hypothetical protein TNCV_1240211 [Trichonephila clavipes]|uniref:Uncharacterized protein n=1 Tax=Trichonephila clavipes TaxID=2585209 RepID=A0A8X6WE41_TRICX|nr:hypothetical protein TNCV_1240211 [Trichonephila clavipes]
MAAVYFLNHENPPTWARVEPATLGADGKRQTNYATQSAVQNINNGEWLRDFISHSSHSSYLEPTEYPLFRALTDAFKRKIFDNLGNTKTVNQALFSYRNFRLLPMWDFSPTKQRKKMLAKMPMDSKCE